MPEKMCRISLAKDGNVRQRIAWTRFKVALIQKVIERKQCQQALRLLREKHRTK
jgi:hypothetical protein